MGRKKDFQKIIDSLSEKIKVQEQKIKEDTEELQQLIADKEEVEKEQAYDLILQAREQGISIDDIAKRVFVTTKQDAKQELKQQKIS